MSEMEKIAQRTTMFSGEIEKFSLSWRYSRKPPLPSRSPPWKEVEEHYRRFTNPRRNFCLGLVTVLNVSNASSTLAPPVPAPTWSCRSLWRRISLRSNRSACRWTASGGRSRQNINAISGKGERFGSRSHRIGCFYEDICYFLKKLLRWFVRVVSRCGYWSSELHIWLWKNWQFHICFQCAYWFALWLLEFGIAPLEFWKNDDSFVFEINRKSN